MALSRPPSNPLAPPDTSPIRRPQDRDGGARYLIALTILLLGIAALIFLVGWKLTVTKEYMSRHVFWILATLPGIVAILNHLISVQPRFESNRQLLEKWPDGTRASIYYVPVPEQFKPSFAYSLLGALSLVVAFSIPAAISETNPNHGMGLGVKARSDRLTKGSTTSPSVKRSAVGDVHHPLSSAPVPSQEGEEGTDTEPALSGTTSIRTSTRPVPDDNTETGDKNLQKATDDSPRSDLAEGRAGLLYAAYGVYIYTAYLFIARLNASALTGKFLVNSSLRALIAMLMGFTAGEVGAFRAVATENQSLFIYFAIGLAPWWALGALRRRARDLFKPDEEGCDALPLCLVDGLDERVMDRLEEIGIWDVQHLATSHPVELIMKTLYPAKQVLDWMDQAILIGSIRRQIPRFREVGIRGAIDLATIYGDATGRLDPEKDADQIEDSSLIPEDSGPRKLRADGVITILSQKSNFSVDSLQMIGRNLYEDALVNFIWGLWQEQSQHSVITVRSPSTETSA